MSQPPDSIGGGRVICYATIDEHCLPTGSCRHVVAGIVQEPAKGVAICEPADGDCFYLFGCDASWNSITDSWHGTLGSAKKQAEFEYAGISQVWQNVAQAEELPHE